MTHTGSTSRASYIQNGPWLLPWNTTDVIENPYSWTNLSNIVWIEQPVGTGFTSGQASAQDELDVAHQFIGFLKNFYATFSELQGKNLWLTGESYAGKVRLTVCAVLVQAQGLIVNAVPSTSLTSPQAFTT